MTHNARVLCLAGDLDVIHEMRMVNADETGIRHMLPKTRFYVVKLERVRRPVAHILKETFLSNGGEAVIDQKVIIAAVDSTDVLLSGSRKHLQRAIQALLEQGLGCKELAGEIEAAIRHFDSVANVVDPGAVADPRIAGLFGKIGARTLIMGVLNVTPDSFSDGGKFANREAAARRAMEMVEEGADIIDIGGESTRPGSQAVSAPDEIARVVPVIGDIAGKVGIPISIDTYKSSVASAALDAGALIVNDISGAAFDPEMPALIARRRCPAILSHIQGTPRDMQLNPTYTDLLGEICAYLRERIEAVADAGADKRMLIVDPGMGFGKTVEHNLELLRRLREIKSIGRPVLIGPSRKATIGKVLGGLPPEDRLEGTLAAVAISIANGADIVRVHDVKAAARAARMADAIVRVG